ncbi:hypothetical protein [Halococcoides cellulosivorans]|uniref:Uncharacterized protein n=1 Tax=Halococcoides cellulosivorans TaxID=1679096 RepID=A0A2R4X413_9EURY|nr:hypothetical protein [Halococcoides cellulosivorans]AWB28443.1 hypothetical protein HARCEL1_12405 [Halococcoides cellulosivorans]
MEDSDEFETSVDSDSVEAISMFVEYDSVRDAESVQESIETALDLYGTPAYGYTAVTPQTMEDEPAFIASVGIASLMQLLDEYGHVLNEETEEAFKETKGRLLRFEEARMRMDDE